MNHTEIKKALSNVDLTFAALGEATGRNPQNFSAVSRRKIQSRPVALIIAAALEKPIVEVFPDVPQYVNPSKKAQKEQRVDKAKKLIKAAGLRELVS